MMKTGIFGEGECTHTSLLGGRSKWDPSYSPQPKVFQYLMSTLSRSYFSDFSYTYLL